MKSSKKRYECEAIWEFLVDEVASAKPGGRTDIGKSGDPLHLRKRRVIRFETRSNDDLTGKEMTSICPL